MRKSSGLFFFSLAVLLLAVLFSTANSFGSFTSGQEVVSPYQVHPFRIILPNTILSCVPLALCPSLVTRAYGFDLLQRSGINGTSQTIVIDDACGDPNITTDLHTFDTTFGLKDPSITVIYPQGTSGLCVDKGWAGETALDVEWAHVVAPGAAIDILAANQPSPADMYGAWNYSLTNDLGNQISNSYGGAGCFQSCNNTLGQGIGPCTLTNGTQGVNVEASLAMAQARDVTILASSGDSGYWGANTPNEEMIPGDCAGVLTVGGTSLHVDWVGNYLGESAWNESGGGFVTKSSEPNYQLSTILNDPLQTLAKPDVAAIADPRTGVWTYANGGWFVIGGTSLSSPLWAGFLADVNQIRASHGFRPAGFLNQFLYETIYGNSTLYSEDFNQIKSGNNGWSAVDGWNPVTGLGTFIAPSLANTLGTNPNA